MAKTIVGIFDDNASAQNAMRELQGIGVQRDHIRLTQHESDRTAAGAKDPSWKDRIFGMFEALFEDESDRSHAHHYAEAWRRGHFIVVADIESNLEARAVEIMNRFGTVDIEQRLAHWKETGYTGAYDRAAAPYTAEQRSRELAHYQTQRNQAIPVVQEEMRVGKQVVQRGGVRIHSYVREQPVAETVRLREERVNVQRRPVDRPADSNEMAFNERTVDVTARGEEAVVEKRGRVVEEVVVGKQAEEREQTVTGTVRRKDVDVEQIAQDQAKSGAAAPKTSDQGRR
jgi:uncharacterized protein (TIGR02271 family)